MKIFMDLYIKKVFEHLPSGLDEKIPIQFHTSDRISILEAENVFSQENAFNSFKFLAVYSNSHPLFKICSKKFKIKRNKFFSVNPGQEHNSELTGKVPAYNAIFIDKEFLEETSKELFKTTRINFENRNNPISPHLRHLFQKFIYEDKNKQPGYKFVLQGLNLQIAVNILREIRNNSNKKTPIPGNYKDARVVRKVIDFLETNYHKDFSLDDLAKEVNYSPFHLIRIFKNGTGKTPFEYLQYIKILKAKEILQNSEKTITEVCFEAGFNNRSHFISVFKKNVGVPPSSFRYRRLK